jgi:hypothetical protein
MGFNKRYINIESLKAVSKRGLNYLISYVNKPDGLIIQDSKSKEICNILRSNISKVEMENKLKNIGFYEFDSLIKNK